MKSSHYSFSQPKLPEDTRLERLSFDEFLEMQMGEFTLPSFPAKRLPEMVRLVREGKSDQISIFEWLDVIEDQKQWDAQTEDENVESCIAAWSTIGTNHVLGDIVMFKVALSIDGRPTSIVNHLTQTMHIARTAKGLAPLEARKIDWLLALQKQDFPQLVQYCYEQHRSVPEFIRYLRLPQANHYAEKVSANLLTCIDEGDLSETNDTWLHRNFINLKTTKQRVAFCESFITKFAQFNYGELCEELIVSQCLPNQDENYWNQLSITAKQILKKKFNLSNYFDLRSISSALYSEQAAEELGFTENQTRQIRSRSMFWSNYSAQFERVRVLLPKNSFHFVKARNRGLPPFVDDIDETGSLDTEVYIFELGKTIAVEFLRGALSETRFFKNDSWYSKRLFDSKALTIAEIRTMSQLDVHDHLPSWQYFLEKLLRTKFEVTPNTNIPYFRGLPPEVNQYQQGHGLVVEPDEKMLIERREKLESWVESFWASELQTGKFGELVGLEKKSTLYLSKALMAKQLGNQDDYELFIRKAANQGNSEAMWQLGKAMLLSSKSDAKTRSYGEEWVSKAAAKGHKEAMETADRFRIAY
ncbi:EH signature domain-containing protein [Vibrio neptunius]|uniref:EH signature domain-containing protein n=1 Tax=Vibrio neptunius TaxID=170651 RepID=UPI00214F0A3C|nr:EH signature domain-containing protein [Vibrio neptunius]